MLHKHPMPPRSRRAADLVLVVAGLAVALLVIAWSAATSVDTQLATAVSRVGETAAVVHRSR
jgi:ferric-dicitrate binding protein FerR (iron transport regulator)